MSVAAQKIENEGWTDERLGHLRRLYESGLTASEAGRALGVSGNAVSGQLRKLGLGRGRKGRFDLVRPAGSNGAGLLAAIGGLEAAERELVRHDRATEKAEALVRLYQGKVQDVVTNAKAIDDAHDAALAAAIVADRPLPTKRRKTAAEAEAVAKRDLEAAKAALAKLRGDDRRLGELAILEAKAHVLIEANKIMAPTVAKIVERAEAAMETIKQANEVLRWLGLSHLYGAGTNSADREIDFPGSCQTAGLAYSEVNHVEATVASAQHRIPGELRERVAALLQFYNPGSWPSPIVEAFKAARIKLIAGDVNVVMPEI